MNLNKDIKNTKPDVVQRLQTLGLLHSSIQGSSLEAGPDSVLSDSKISENSILALDQSEHEKSFTNVFLEMCSIDMSDETMSAIKIGKHLSKQQSIVINSIVVNNYLNFPDPLVFDLCSVGM